jgi:hypothetical protein
MFHQILAALEGRWVAAAVAAGSSIDSNSSRIDMANYESALFVTSISDSVATGVATLNVEESDADSDGAMAAITDATATATSATNDDLNGTLLMVEVRNPAKRYIQGVRTSATANIAYDAMYVFLKPREKAAAQGATVSDSAFVSD